MRQLKIGKTKLGKADGSGRKKPVLIKNSEKILDVDKLVIAFGYEADPQSFIAENNIKVSDRGLISLDNENYKYQTSNPKFFAGGDMIIGSSLAVHAIAHGRDAAKEIIKFLET